MVSDVHGRAPQFFDLERIGQFIAAALIEERYGIQDRGEYLFEVFSGVAK